MCPPSPKKYTIGVQHVTFVRHISGIPVCSQIQGTPPQIHNEGTLMSFQSMYINGVHQDREGDEVYRKNAELRYKGDISCSAQLSGIAREYTYEVYRLGCRNEEQRNKQCTGEFTYSR